MDFQGLCIVLAKLFGWTLIFLFKSSSLISAGLQTEV